MRAAGHGEQESGWTTGAAMGWVMPLWDGRPREQGAQGPGLLGQVNVEQA